jgi:hypothetical protein
MKTKRFLVFGLSAVLLALGLVLAGCDDGSDDDGDSGVSKSVTITNISGIAGTCSVWVFPEIANPPANVALFHGTIANNTLTVALTVPQSGNPMMETERRWTGSGSFYVGLIPIVNGQYDNNNAKITKNKVNFAADVSLVTLDYGTEFEAFSE